MVSVLPHLYWVISQQFNRYVSTSTNAKEFQKRDFFYGQDTWRATPKLTSNLGLRYELYFPETSTPRQRFPDEPGLPATFTLQVWGNSLQYGCESGKNTWNPRLGVAYQANRKHSDSRRLRRSFDLGVFGSIFGHVVTQNLPVLANQAINATGGTSTYAFNLTNPAFTQGGQATGPSIYVPLKPDANGHIVNPGSQVTSKARPFTEPAANALCPLPQPCRRRERGLKEKRRRPGGVHDDASAVGVSDFGDRRNILDFERPEPGDLVSTAGRSADQEPRCRRRWRDRNRLVSIPIRFSVWLANERLGL